MKPSRNSSESPTLTFSGAAALLLLVAAFCAYPLGAYLPALGLATLAFICLSLSAPKPEVIRVPSDDYRPRSPRRDPR